jgi:Na+/melibiose symporter-like transporter
MNDRKNALLLSGFLFLCVWLILFLVAVTETGGVKYNFAFAATLAALCGVVCMVCYFTLDVMERRKDASGIYNFEYYRLKRRTRRELEQAREENFSELQYIFRKEEIEYYFKRDACIIGIDAEQIAADFSEIAGAVK